MNTVENLQNAINYTKESIEKRARKIADNKDLPTSSIVRLATELNQYATTLSNLEVEMQELKEAEAKVEREAKKAAALKEGGIGVIDVFLEEFKQKEIDWFMAMKDMYMNNYEEFREQRRTGDISKTVALIVAENSRKGITELIERDMIARRYKLLQAISKKAGDVVSARLAMNHNGGFDGTVTGTDATVTISTIVAGGYNIQRAHYRTLVHIAK